MNITLRAGERLYLNGAVIRLDRKATIELLNDAAFLLENHIIQASEATTPLRQVYFVVQVMLMDPAAARSAMDLLHQLIDKALCAFESPEIKAGLNAIVGSVARSRHFEAMKSLRSLYVLEQLEMFPSGEQVASQAA
jgi:flagellar biosynthesis repressor protein FlbT